MVIFLYRSTELAFILRWKSQNTTIDGVDGGCPMINRFDTYAPASYYHSMSDMFHFQSRVWTANEILSVLAVRRGAKISDYLHSPAAADNLRDIHRPTNLPTQWGWTMMVGLYCGEVSTDKQNPVGTGSRSVFIIFCGLHSLGSLGSWATFLSDPTDEPVDRLTY